MKKILVAVMLIVGSTMGNAAGLDLALSDETANLQLLINPYGIAAGNSEVAIGGLINDEDDVLFFASVMARGPRQSNSAFYSLGAGMKIYGGNLDLDQSIGALAIGARIGILIVPHPVNPVDLVVEGFFAPSITSAGDTEKLWEISTKLQLEIVPAARAYLGYRLVKVDTKDFGKVELDDNLHIGINISF